MSAVGLTADGLSAWYGPRQVLAGVDLSIDAGQIVAVMGPAEAGKSTLLRVINRLAELEPGFRLEGTVRIDDRDVSEVDPTELRRTVGMVFERTPAGSSGCGTNCRTSDNRQTGWRPASGSVSASPAPSPFSPPSCCWTSRPGGCTRPKARSSRPSWIVYAAT
mgnify:CR=1 FL=1